MQNSAIPVILVRIRPSDHKFFSQSLGGRVVAIAIVLSAVFIPTAFISGITGQFYRQFALTIAVSLLRNFGGR